MIKMNDDTIKEIFFKKGLAGLLTAIKKYNTDRYFDVYEDGVKHGIMLGFEEGYRRGKLKGYSKAIKDIVSTK